MKYEYWFATLQGINSREKIRLREMLGNGQEVYRLLEYPMEELHMIPAKVRQALEAGGKDRDWEQRWEKFSESGLQLVHWNHAEYPKKLKHIYDPPYCLFVKGKLPTKERNVAIVGARGCSPYGQAVAERIGKEMAMRGIGVISGLAIGIDTAAHQGALVGKGLTYAVMGCGVDVCYPPSNEKLYQQIVTQGGVLSEFSCGTQPGKLLFPMRNRIISGLADAVIVVEARRKSGSLITADYALDQGKTVYAVPGRINDSLSYGANWLLSQGATPLYSIEEFLKDMGEVVDKNELSEKFIENLLEKNERLVYSCLDFTPKHMEVVIMETKLDFVHVAEILNCLQQRGVVREVYKNYYAKTVLE